MSVIGIDEVGRGSWAGPLLVVAAYAVNELPAGLKDSKLLSKKQRKILFDQINAVCKLGEGWVRPNEIDDYGLTQAMRLGVSRALKKLKARLDDEIIIDGHINYCPAEFVRVRAIINADATEPIVSAASIYAKVLRDQHMYEWAELFPVYGFEKHVGYGTRLHGDMLRLHGPCELHRKTFKPIENLQIIAQ